MFYFKDHYSHVTLSFWSVLVRPQCRPVCCHIDYPIRWKSFHPVTVELFLLFAKAIQWKLATLHVLFCFFFAISGDPGLRFLDLTLELVSVPVARIFLDSFSQS